jgi:dipeptidyl aminopeptidase/acylaminoacyl peptidase
MKLRNRWLLVMALVAACGGGGSKDPQLPTGGDGSAAVGPGEGTGGTAGTAGTVAAPPAAVGRPSEDLIDRRILFGNPERANVQISPNGKFLSWLAPKDGVLNVFVAPVGKLGEAKAVTADSTRPVRTYFWAFDNQHLVYSQDKGGDENFHLFRVKVATGEVTDLTDLPKVRAQLINLSPRKPGLILVGLNDRDPALHDVWQIELANGKKTLVQKNELGFAGWQADDDFKLRIGAQVAPDGSTIAFTPDGKGGWSEFDRTGPRDSFGILAFDKRGEQAYVTDDRDRNTAALYLMNLKTKAKKLILEDARADVSNVVFHPTEHTPLAATIEYDRDRVVVLDRSTKADFEGIAKLGDGDAYVASTTLDSKTWVVVINGDRQPSRYFLWNRAKKRGEVLFSSRPDLEGKPLARMHPVIIESRDGKALVSYLTLPIAADANDDGKADKPTPTVMVVHGGPWGRDSWGFNGIHQLLANRGYAVLSVNFRGSTGLGKDFLNAGNGEWGKKMHDDLIDAKRWLVAQNVTPADKLCIMGGSYGGYATLAGLTLTPDEFACGVDIVGPSNIITLLNSIPPYWAPILGLFRFRVGDWNDPAIKQQLIDTSPLTHAAAIKRPLLIGQGANDPRVKQAESDQIVKAMQAKGLPVSYVLFPDEGHGFARPENNLTFYAAAEAFLSAHLGGSYQPITKQDVAASTAQIKVGIEGIPGWPR